MASAPDAGDPQASSVERPRYAGLRFREDWSTLARGAAHPADPWDAVKYVPLSEDGSSWASFGGHMRARLESWSSFGFGGPTNDDDEFLLWRLLLHGDIHFSEHLRVFVEGKSALGTDRDLPGGRRTLDVDTLDLEQAFVDLRMPLDVDATLTLRPGRQQFLFGKQRLVSPLPWANTYRRWDGVSAILEAGSWQVHGFWSWFVPVQKYDFNDSDAQTQFFGAYATTTLGAGGPGLDLYLLGLDRDDSTTINGTTGAEERYTLGGRLFGAFGATGLDYDAEGAYQLGRVGAGDVDAFMLGSELGYRWSDAGGKPRVSLGFDYGSGDDDAGGDVETFNQLYPLGHAYLGLIDAVGRQNIIDVNAGLTVAPVERATLGVRGHWFTLASSDDGLYNAGGTLARGAVPGASRDVGAEVDLTLEYRFDRHLVGLLGYSHFFAGDFLEDTGASDDVDFAYLQLQYTF